MTKNMQTHKTIAKKYAKHVVINSENTICHYWTNYPFYFGNFSHAAWRYFLTTWTCKLTQHCSRISRRTPTPAIIIRPIPNWRIFLITLPLSLTIFAYTILLITLTFQQQQHAILGSQNINDNSSSIDRSRSRTAMHLHIGLARHSCRLLTHSLARWRQRSVVVVN